jgi:hypothetical protein
MEAPILTTSAKRDPARILTSFAGVITNWRS